MCVKCGRQEKNSYLAFLDISEAYDSVERGTVAYDEAIWSRGEVCEGM